VAEGCFEGATKWRTRERAGGGTAPGCHGDDGKPRRWRRRRTRHAHARSGRRRRAATGTEAEEAAAAAANSAHLFKHCGHPTRRDDVARMDEAIQQLRRRLDGLLLILGEARGCAALRVEDGVQRILVVGDLRRKSRQVEVVLHEVELDLGEELVAFQRAEPRNPAARGNAAQHAVSCSKGGELRPAAHQDASSPSLPLASDSSPLASFAPLDILTTGICRGASAQAPFAAALFALQSGTRPRRQVRTGGHGGDDTSARSRRTDAPLYRDRDRALAESSSLQHRTLCTAHALQAARPPGRELVALDGQRNANQCGASSLRRTILVTLWCLVTLKQEHLQQPEPRASSPRATQRCQPSSP
jgi:hypothetical protein